MNNINDKGKYIFPKDDNIFRWESSSKMDISNNIGDEVIIMFPWNDMINQVRTWDGVTLIGRSHLEYNHLDKDGNIYCKVAQQNDKLTVYETFALFTIKVNQDGTDAAIFRITQQVKQEPNGQAKVEQEIEQKADDAKKKLEEQAAETSKKGIEMAQQAIGGAITELVTVAEDTIDEVLKTTLGIDVTVSQATSALNKSKESLKKSQNSEKKLKEKIEKYKKRQAEGKKINEEKLAAMEAQLEALEQDNKDTDEEVQKEDKRVGTLAKDLLQKAKDGLMGSQLKKELDNIKLQGGVIADNSEKLVESMSTAATEGVGATQTGTAGPYPAVTSTTTPSPSQLAGTAMRLASAGKSLAAPVLSLCQSAAKLGLPESVVSPLATPVKLIGKLSQFSL